MSDQSPTQRIIARQQEQARKQLQQVREAEAEGREQAELRDEWDTVAYWLAPDGTVASVVTGEAVSPATAVGPIAVLSKALVHDQATFCLRGPICSQP
jgi:hypothetical protein